jgi:hypothetical protein
MLVRLAATVSNGRSHNENLVTSNTNGHAPSSGCASKDVRNNGSRKVPSSNRRHSSQDQPIWVLADYKQLAPAREEEVMGN